ncbi:MAG: glycine betaine ABC transporter substrate-binding protein [Candidatus Dormibacteria bacterium]
MRRSVAIAFTALCLPLLAACGSSDNSGKSSSGGASSTCPGGGNANGNGNGASLKIGSKTFAEEQLLASMAKQVLEKHGYKVDFTAQADDPAIDQALRSKQIDMLWQYTGTELQNFLKVTNPPTDLDKAFAQVKELDAANGLCWVAPAPMNDTNGIAIRKADVGKYGSSLSEFTKYVTAHPDTKVCIRSEFRTRADGLIGLNRVYGHWDFPGLTDIQGNAEKVIADGSCAAGEVFTTDSGIAAKDLVALSDDKKLFPPDNVGLIVNSAVLQAHPDIQAILAPMASKITSSVITGLNKQVEIDGKPFEVVAKAYLQSNGLI